MLTMTIGGCSTIAGGTNEAYRVRSAVAFLLWSTRLTCSQIIARCDGLVTEVVMKERKAKDLIVGDLLYLESGAIVPADIVVSIWASSPSLSFLLLLLLLPPSQL